HGDTAQAHHLLGMAYAAANQPDEAERQLRAAVERDPLSEPFAFDFGQMQLAFGVAAYGQRRFADAIDAFLRVTAIDPSVEQPYVFMARILPQAGDRLLQ